MQRCRMHHPINSQKPKLMISAHYHLIPHPIHHIFIQYVLLNSNPTATSNCLASRCCCIFLFSNENISSIHCHSFIVSLSCVGSVFPCLLFLISPPFRRFLLLLSLFSYGLSVYMLFCCIMDCLLLLFFSRYLSLALCSALCYIHSLIPHQPILYFARKPTESMHSFPSPLSSFALLHPPLHSSPPLHLFHMVCFFVFFVCVFVLCVPDRRSIHSSLSHHNHRYHMTEYIPFS